MKTCGKQCPTCPFVKTTKFINGNNFKWKIGKSLTCETKNVIYMVECKKENCHKQYIGETERCLKERFSDHKNYVRNKHLNQATGAHFNEPGHEIEHMQIIAIEKLQNKNPQYRKEKEKFFIQKFDTYYNGINRRP